MYLADMHTAGLTTESCRKAEIGPGSKNICKIYSLFSSTVATRKIILMVELRACAKKL